MFKNNQKINFQVKFIFNDMKEAIKVKNLLKKYNFEVSGIIGDQSTYNHRERRLRFIMNNLTDQTTMGKFFKSWYSKSFSASYKTFQRDTAILLLQDKIKAETKDQKTLIWVIK